LQVKKIDKSQRKRIIEEISNSISSFLEDLVEAGKVRTYEFSVRVSDDWPYILEIDISVSVNPFFEHEREKIVEKAMNTGLRRAKEIFAKFGLSEL